MVSPDFGKQLLYRFRKPHFDIDNGQRKKKVTEELENQEIFLATIGENNDPMDGLQDVFWEGDTILWKNLIKHYCLCLMDSLIKINIFGNSRFFQHKDVRLWLTPDDLETNDYRELYTMYVKEVFQDKRTDTLLKIFTSKRKLCKVELSWLLSMFNFVFLHILNKVTKGKLGFEVMPSIEEYTDECIRRSKFDVDKAFSSLEKLTLSVEGNFLHLLSDIASGMNDEIILIEMYKERYAKQNKTFDNHIAVSNIFHVLLFSKVYLEATIEQIYPSYYVTCFSRCNNNCSTWGHYADGHRGICLIFQTKIAGDKEYIELENGEKLFFTSITYDDMPPTLNYFENIAYIPMPKLWKYWLTDGEDRSALYDHYAKFDRDEFWNRYMQKISHKFKDWNYEAETRAVKSLFWFETLDPKTRTAKYKFEHLRGIIFGMRTDEDMKLEVTNIVEQKMKQYGKRDFEFYQAEYSSFERKLVIRKLGLINNAT